MKLLASMLMFGAAGYAQAPIRIQDGTGTNLGVVKSANAAPTYGDDSVVTALSPNNQGLPVVLPAIRQDQSNSSGGNTSSLAVTLASSVTTGDSLVVGCAVGNTTAPTISDNLSQTYKTVTTVSNSALTVSLFFASGVGSGSTTITCSNGGSAVAMAMQVWQVTGLLRVTTSLGTVGAGQPEASATNTGSSGTATTAAFTPVQGNEFAFFIVGIGTGLQTINPGTGWVNDSGNLNPSSPTGLFAAAGMSQLNPGLVAITPTATFTSEPWAIAAANFRTVALAIQGTVDINNTPTVQIGNTPNTTPILVQSEPGTTGGLTFYNLEPAASDNHANIKNGAGMVYHISATNNSATINYLRLYNAASGFNGCNSATNLQWEIMIPANTSAAGFVEDIAMGVTFATGISICVTGAFGQTNTTNATASAIEINIGYK